MNEILNQEKSIYIQISEMIENDILRDVLLEDERVPSTNELAKLYAINPSTAAKGINILVDAGILYKKRVIGMFVSDGAKEVIRTKRKARFLKFNNATKQKTKNQKIFVYMTKNSKIFNVYRKIFYSDSRNIFVY